MMEWGTKSTTETAIAQGAQFPEEVKELAYQLWAFVAGRNAAEVVRLLRTEEYGAVEVHRNTAAYWAREYRWAERVARDVQAIAPDLRHQTFSELLFAGLEGAKYIRRVASGKEDVPDISDLIEQQKDRETARGPIDIALQLDARVRAHDSARKARLSASVSAVDRIGFSPVGKGAPGVELPTTNSDLPAVEALTGKSPDELMRMEQAFRERKGR